MWLYIPIAVIVLILIYIIAMYNSFVRINNKVKEAFSTMDVYLKKRWDLIPNIVETVKGYSKHESETLQNVVRLRNSAYDTMSPTDKIETNSQLSGCLSKIMALAESYPDLKANQNFLELSRQLSKIEEDIANARKYYNGVIRMYNDKIQSFPNNILAKLFGYSEKTMFETAQEERNNVNISF